MLFTWVKGIVTKIKMFISFRILVRGFRNLVFRI